MNPGDIREIAVIGLGTMGPGIAQSFARAGCQVCSFDLKQEALETSRRVVRSSLETLVGFGSLSQGEAEAAMANIRYSTSFTETVKEAQVIVESVTEDRAIKTQVYSQVAEHAPLDCLLWSNTSTLNIHELVPESIAHRSIIAHWFSPPHILPLVEVVKGPKTAPQTTEATLALLKRMQKTPVVMEKFVPGFAVNRIQRIIGREVFHLLDGGYMSPEDLDLAVKASLAPRMMLLGLVQRMDFTGLDLSARNLLDEQFFDPPLDNRPVCLQSKIDSGDLGIKTGKGFFDYSGQDLTQVLADRDRYLLEIMRGVQFCLDKGRLL